MPYSTSKRTDSSTALSGGECLSTEREEIIERLIGKNPPQAGANGVRKQKSGRHEENEIMHRRWYYEKRRRKTTLKCFAVYIAGHNDQRGLVRKKLKQNVPGKNGPR